MTIPTGLKLKHQGWEVEICTEFGASLSLCRFDERDILRPAPDNWQGDPLLASSFLMLPFSGRVAHGRFKFQDAQIKLAQTHPDIELPIHGTAWHSKWVVRKVRKDMARFSMTYDAGNWPWSFEAEYEVSIIGNVFKQVVRLKNLSGSFMPFGLGFHPFFPCSSETTLEFSADGIWNNDEILIPRQLSSVKPEHDFSAGRRLVGQKYDNCFTGFGGQARINETIKLNASDNLDHAIVYIPEGEDFFCFEPATHMPNAFNTENVDVLEPRASIEASFEICVG